MRILFRADSSPIMGSGHVMRCLALADMLAADGDSCTFVAASLSEILADKIRRAGHALHLIEPHVAQRPTDGAWDSLVLPGNAQRKDAQDSLRAAEGSAFDWVVVDHYQLDHEWETVARSGSGRILVIDDLANRLHDCDLLLDQTFGRRAEDYAAWVPATCRLITGARYALLRPEFAAARPAALARRRHASSIERLLISLGTTDVGGITAVAAEAALDAGVAKALDIVIGSGAPSFSRIEELARGSPRIRMHVDGADMACLISEADLAIGAAGTSAWERCCLGLPAVTLVLAGNQRLVAKRLEEVGAIWIAEDAAQIRAMLSDLAGDECARPRMIAAAAAITDGRGAIRVAAAMTGAPGEKEADMTLTIRAATGDDAEAVWLWRNDPETRAASLTHAPVAWDDHIAWWRRSLRAGDRHLFIIERGGEPTAIVRFDRIGANPKTFEVSINLRPEARGAGVGGAALAKACDRMMQMNESVRLEASIHESNAASIRAFERLGFASSGRVGESGFRRYVRARPASSANGLERLNDA